MPFSRPTLTALRNTAVQDITTSGIPGITGLLRNSVLRVLAWCMAGLAYSVYGYADWVARMGVPFTAENEFLYAWAALIGVYPKPATSASGSAAFTGTPGIVLPQGTPLIRQDSTPYVTTADGTVDASGNVTVPMTATVTGAFTDTDPGTAISVATPIAGINSGGITVGYTTGGADSETNDELRSRMLAQYRAPPQGGAASDYVLWALQVPGVTRAWCDPLLMGTGTVTVYAMLDDVESAYGGFPQGTDGVSQLEARPASGIATGDQGLVANHIYPLQPVTALVYVASPTAYELDVVLEDLDPSDEATQNAIIASIQNMLLQIGEPGGVVYPSDLYEAILATPGVIHCTMISPVLALHMPTGALPVFGNLIMRAGLVTPPAIWDMATWDAAYWS